MEFKRYVHVDLFGDPLPRFVIDAHRGWLAERVPLVADKSKVDSVGVLWCLVSGVGAKRVQEV